MGEMQNQNNDLLPRNNENGSLQEIWKSPMLVGVGEKGTFTHYWVPFSGFIYMKNSMEKSQKVKNKILI